MPAKKNKKKKKSKHKEVVIPNSNISNICFVCNDWCRPVDDGDEELGYACEDCPHVYHDRCIRKAFRNRKFDTCSDLGHECDDKPALIFEFGPEIDHIAQRKKKQPKGRIKRSTRMHKTDKKRRKSAIGGIHKKTYTSFKYMHIEYKLGDDVVFELEEGPQVARVREIFAYNDDTMPKMDILWFWTADQALRDMKGANDQENTNNTNNFNNDDTTIPNEIHIDDAYQQNLNVDDLVDTTKSSKALVVSSSSQYLVAIDKSENTDKYYDIYWCTHAYSGNTKKKSLLSSDAISSHQIVGITPAKSRKSRKRDRKSRICDALCDASKSLMLSSVPSRLPCREKEHDEIFNYMKVQISQKGQGSGLYISGMPGTGKTATVRQIANELKELTVGSGKTRGRKKKNNKLPNFEFNEINAMKLPTPQHIYSELAKKLMGKHFSPNTAVKKLVQYFSTADANRVICVLLVDELDYLLTRQQKVIYNIFDWPTKTNGKLVVIGIANTMDLPERLLPRVSSRMGTARVVFKAYQRHQLTRIIEARLESTKVFSKDAIRFCASAVAGVSGDCRTALQICRRAVEIAQKDVLNDHNNSNKRAKTSNNRKNRKNNNNNMTEVVTLQHLKSAKAAFEQSNDIQIVCSLSIYEKFFLTAIVMYNTRNNSFAGTTLKYRQKFDSFIETRLGETKMNNVHFRNMMNRLKDMAVIKVAFDKKEWKEFITFNIKIEEAAHALKENDICAKVLSTLQAA